MIALLLILAIAPAVVLVLVAQGSGARDDGAARDRAILITACIEVGDVVDSDAVRERLLDALDEVGVRPVVVAAGEPFDSSRHRAVGTASTPDAASHNLVAGTERAGFSDHGRRLRWPDVVVFDSSLEVAK